MGVGAKTPNPMRASEQVIPSSPRESNTATPSMGSSMAARRVCLRYAIPVMGDNLGMTNSRTISPCSNRVCPGPMKTEMTNVWGETEDVYAIGAKHSELDDYCRRAAENLELDYIPERLAHLGYFFRSDQLSFARAGIPAVWLHEGITSKGEEKDYIIKKNEAYRRYRYHHRLSCR